MILEIANIMLKPGIESEFETAVAKARPLFADAQGFRSLNLRRNIEQPLLYHLLIEWETLKDHTETFRHSAGFQAWRELVGHCFQQPPEVSHNRLVDLDR